MLIFFKKGKLKMNFKELRSSQHITLKQASQGICSMPMLSRWENGTGNMDFDKAIKLLERINIKATEYISLNNIDLEDEISLQLKAGWTSKNKNCLKILAKKQLSIFHTTHQLIDLDYAAISCALYKRLTHINLFPISDQNKINKQLSSLTIWTQENLSLFQSIINLLSPAIIFQVSSQVIANLDFIKKSGPITLHVAITTLFETVIYLLKNKKINYSKRILNELNNISLPDSEMQLIVGRAFLNALIDYLDYKDDKKILEIVDFLVKLNMTKTATYFLQTFKDIKKQNN